MSDAAGQAAEAITASQAGVLVTTPGNELPPDAPPVVFDRLSVERRVLCAVTDDFYSDRLGARNTLPAIAEFLLTDPNTTNPPAPNGRLEIEGLTLTEQVQLVLDNLERLIAAGLVTRAGDINDPFHTYHLTEAGQAELKT